MLGAFASCLRDWDLATFTPGQSLRTTHILYWRPLYNPSLANCVDLQNSRIITALRFSVEIVSLFPRQQFLYSSLSTAAAFEVSSSVVSRAAAFHVGTLRWW